MAFPTTLDDLDASRGTSTQALSSPSHVTHHTNEDTLIEALQAKVGIDSSTVTTSLDYILKNTTAGHDHDGTDSKKVIVTNLDVAGLTALGLIRTNTGGTALESAGVAVSDLITATSTTTLTNKTLTAPVIATIVNTGTLTLPTSTDTLVGRATTDILTNKTLTAPKIVSGGFIADANGNEQIIFTTTASAVNEVTVTNAATGNDPEISATGGDTNIGIKMTPKGTGIFRIGTSARARAYANTAQTLTNASLALISLDTESYDPGGNFTPTVTFKFTAPISGYYLVAGRVCYVANATGTRAVSIKVNGAVVSEIVLPTVTTANATEMMASDIIYLAATDYVQLFGYQTSGGNLNIVAVDTYMTVHLLSV